MKKLFVIAGLLMSLGVRAQTGYFNSLDNLTGWTTGSGYTLTNDGTQLKVDAVAVGSKYQTFSFGFAQLDLTNHPYIQLNLKTSTNANAKVRIDFVDNLGKVTNAIPTTVVVPASSGYQKYTFDYTGKFRASYPKDTVVDPAKIRAIIVYFNPGGATGYTGTVFFDSLRIGSEAKVPPLPKAIKFNQIGFYQNSSKIAIAAQSVSDSFYVVSSDKKDTLYRALLQPAKTWTYSAESVRKADFSSFNSVGTFYLSVDSGYSIPFTIAPQIHLGLTKGLLKGYYFNRCSKAIEQPWADKWPRSAGHLDNTVYVHASAATANTPEGTTFKSPGGWYDAGDYNKYTVNAGISTYTMLALYEHFPQYFDTLKTNIPESTNDIPDILDEALWNIRWMLTMQDPIDGGVYHKLSSLNFSGYVMPTNDGAKRYAIQRSTAAALNLAAVAAQSYRIFSKFPKLSEFADSCLTISKKAYDWAVANPKMYVTENPSGVGTGVYGDGNVTDEFGWAAMELYAATRNDKYYNRSQAVTPSFWVPGWANVNTMGLITLVHYRKQLNKAGYADTAAMKSKLQSLANTFKNHVPTSAYGVAVGAGAEGDFNWGSTGNAGGQGLIMLQAFRMTKDSSYLKAALSNLDYLLGRNATGYSFVTGFGYKSPMDPHHRISRADNVEAPIPGMVVGGPNGQQNDGCAGYPSSLPARSYVDTDCSYSTNEPAINYTGTVAYVAGAIEAIMSGVSFTPGYTEPPNSVSEIDNESLISVYPNPASDEVIISMPDAASVKISIIDTKGQVIKTESYFNDGVYLRNIDLKGISAGVYFVSVTSKNYSAVKKLIIQ